MHNKYIFTAAIITTLVLTACSDSNSDSKVATQSPYATETIEMDITAEVFNEVVFPLPASLTEATWQNTQLSNSKAEMVVLNESEHLYAVKNLNPDENVTLSFEIKDDSKRLIKQYQLAIQVVQSLPEPIQTPLKYRLGQCSYEFQK